MFTKIVTIKKIEVILVVAVFMLSFFILSANNSYAGLECPAGFDDCDCDGICETNILSDPFNCGKCGNVCVSCVSGSCASITGGLVPCGRLSDNPGTVWSEQEDCKLCHTIVLANSIIDYLIGIAAIIAIFTIVIGGIFYISSVGNAGRVAAAKTAITKSLYGFVIVFIAWVAINTCMVLFGFDDPFGDGSWKKFDCELMSGPITNYYCGDGLVNNPNDDGIAEVCDPKESKSSFIARTGLTTEDWVEEIYACNPITCDFGCAGDPLVSEIGKGCYEPILADGSIGNTCQKGIYICDFTLSSPAVVCKNTYNNPIYKLAENYCSDVYDYCCVVIEDATYNYNDAENDLNALSWTRVKPPAATDGTCNSYKCDDICKNSGMVCVGTAVTDDMTTSCYGVRCHSGSVCDANGNMIRTDCRVQYPANWHSDHLNACKSNYCSSPEGYYVGYTSCLCF